MAHGAELMVGPIPSVPADAMAWIDADAMREIDRIMVDDLDIRLEQMMENAGRSLADLVRDQSAPGTVLVLAGSGGNGGGGLVAARHLANAGVDVTVHVTGSQLSPVTTHQLAIVRAMGLVVADTADQRVDLIVDAMVGYSLQGPLRTRVAGMGRMLASTDATVVSLDIPSGIDATTGQRDDDAVSADATMTLCAPKRGLRAAGVGELFVADISVPPAVVRSVAGGPAPPFGAGRVLRVLSSPAEGPTA
ncbi:MAG: NAD(P)H-hydrate epimerase [Acidimicrobiales bacterium]